eukprot:gene781-930_t
MSRDELVTACINGDASKVGDLIKSSDDARNTFSELFGSYFPEGLLEKYLDPFLETDLDINLPNVFGMTPLHLAIVRGHENVIKVILEDQWFTNINSQTSSFGNTPLLEALQIVFRGYVKIGSILDAEQRERAYAMHEHFKRYVNIVKLILCHKNVDVNVVSKHGINALGLVYRLFSCIRSYKWRMDVAEAILKVLLDHEEFNVHDVHLRNEDVHGENLLHVLCTEECDPAIDIGFNASMLHMVLKSKHGSRVDVNKPTPFFGITPLISACLHKRDNVVYELLRRVDEARLTSINATAEHYNGDTALMIACCTGLYEPIMCLLRDKRTDIHAVNDYGRTALLEACDLNYIYSNRWCKYKDLSKVLLQVLEYLLQKHCDYYSDDDYDVPFTNPYGFDMIKQDSDGFSALEIYLESACDLWEAEQDGYNSDGVIIRDGRHLIIPGEEYVVGQCCTSKNDVDIVYELIDVWRYQEDIKQINATNTFNELFGSYFPEGLLEKYLDPFLWSDFRSFCKASTVERVEQHVDEGNEFIDSIYWQLHCALNPDRTMHIIDLENGANTHRLPLSLAVVMMDVGMLCVLGGSDQLSLGCPRQGDSSNNSMTHVASEEIPTWEEAINAPKGSLSFVELARGFTALTISTQSGHTEIANLLRCKNVVQVL